MFVTSLSQSLKIKNSIQYSLNKTRSTHALGTGPRWLLFITLYTLVWVKINHIFGVEILSGFLDCVLWTAFVDFKSFANRTDEQMVLLAEVPPNAHWHTWNEINLFSSYCKRKKKCNLVNLDALGLKSVYPSCFFYSFPSSWVLLFLRSSEYVQPSLEPPPWQAAVNNHFNQFLVFGLL